MAIISQADLNFGTTVANYIVSAVNRKTRFIQSVPVSVGINAGGPLWNVEGGGITTVTHADGSSFTTPSKDATAQASLGWGNYETPIQLDDATIAVSNNTSNPNYGGNERARQVANAVDQHLKKMEVDAFSGSGSNSIIGLNTAIDDASTYAGLAHTLAYWQSTVKAGSGGTRAITRPLLRDFLYGLANTAGVDPASMTCYTSFAVYNQMVGLFDNIVQFQTPANVAPAMSVGTSAMTKATFEGALIIPVWDGYQSALNGTIYALPPATAFLEVMPYDNDPSKVIADGLPLGIQVLVDPTGGHSSRYIIRNKIQLKVADPFRCGKMTNIATL